MENRSISKRAIKISAVVLAVSIAVGFILTSIYLGWALRTRPRLDTDRLSSLNHSVTFVCSEGQSITGESIGIGRVPVSLEQVSPYFLDALIVKEDKNFYKHKGVDFRRIVGASVDNIRARTFKEGASTLSQQLIKNTHLSPQKTFTRKIQELSLARKLEREFSKQQILQMYINAIYFGEGSYGIEAAALSYFGKNASCLTLVEAASLASIIRAPNALSPRRCLEVNKRETKFVLTQMFLADKICFTKYQYAKSQDVITKSLQHSPHRSYLLSALNEASKKLGVSQAKLLKQNYKIYTNLCRQTQLLSHNALLKDSFQVKVNATNGDTADALVGVICNHTGRVKAFASKSKYNLTNMRRSPASTIKPVLVYAPAIEHGIISPASTILDQHTNFNGYAPTNFRGTQEGYVSVRHSIKRSLNIPAVKTLNYLGVENAYYYATQINIHLDENDKSLALSLGGLTRGITPLQLANAYVPFANGGTFIEAHFVNKITSGETNNKPRRNFNNNSKYNNHKILYEANPSAKKIYSDCTAYLMTDILRETAQSGTARRLANLNFDVAAKTGTAGTRTFNTDIWNVSYTSADTIVVWLGNASGSEANNLPVRTGGGGIPTFIARYILANKASKSGTASKNITTEKNAALSPPTPPPPFVRPTSVIELE
ncbi:MAG: transglycosylase domain-containing protein, partial [Firmicutes bacterium]|nr:transglycosylase domain-containing protein [Bacillota bacterium]